MASSWSRSTDIGSYGSQMRVTVSIESQNRSNNTSRVRVRIEAYNGGVSRAYNQGSGAKVTVEGNGINRTEQVTFSIAGRSWFEFADWEFTVSHNSDGTLPVNIVGRIEDTGTSSLGDYGAIRVQGTADPLYLTPSAPSWGSTSYQSPSSVRLSWTNRDTARGDYDRVRVQRWLGSTGDWSHRALLSGSAESWTDSSIPSNDQVRWRVRGEGPGGNSGWTYGGTLGTVPAAPSGVSAVKASQGIRVSWTDNAAPTGESRTFLVEDNPDDGGWTQVGSIGGSATSWTHSDADPAVTHQYRVRARITSQIQLTSGYSGASAVVQLQAAPKQPARLAPSDSVAQEIGDTITLRWEHLPVDTTAQTAAEVQWRLDGDAWETVTVSASQDTLDITPGPSGARSQLEWRVRTRGAHPDWSPWSTTNGPMLSTRPMVLIQAPVHEEDLTTSRVEASWTFEPGGSEEQLQQATWSATLSHYSTGTVIETASGTVEDGVSLDTRLQNGVEYALSIAARNGDGLWSSADVSVFSTRFPLPAVVESFPVWDQAAGAVSVGFGESEALRANYRWTGTPGSSTSQEYVEDPAQAVDLTDMITNGDLSDGDTGWSGTTEYERVPVVGPPGGAYSWALSNTTPSEGYTSGRPSTAGAMPVTAGQEYIFEVWINASKAGSVAYIELRSAQLDGGHAIGSAQIIDGGSGDPGSYLMGGYTVPTGWNLYRVRFTPKEGVGTAYFSTFYTNHTNGTVQDAQVWFTGFRLYPASALDGVVETNLNEYPMGASATDRSGWESRFDDPLTFVQEDGEPALRVTCGDRDTTYAEPMQFAKDLPVGAVFTFAVEVKVDQPLSNMRAESIVTAGAVDNLGANDGPQEPGDGWVKRWGVYQVTNAGTVRVMVWPTSMNPGESFAVRRAMILAGDQREHIYFDGDTVGTTDVDAIDVERRQQDGSWLLIASGIPTSTTVTDRTPHIGDVQYRAISRTVLPTEQEGPPATAVWVHDRDPVFVNGGDSMDQLCLARGSEATDDHQVDQALHRFAGQEKPTAFFGPGQQYRTSFTGRIFAHYHLPTSTRAEWVALLQERGLVCFRDCTGRKVFGVLSVGFSQAGNTESVDIDVEEAVYTEGVRRVTDHELEQGV